jgi:orotidine-5'-phosphate decarboxylase
LVATDNLIIEDKVNFLEKLNSASQQNGSLLCVGLDPDPGLMPEKTGVLEFNRAIIEATSDVVCAYKLNFAFYEALDSQGVSTLKQTIKDIPEEIPVIGDAKRGDIGNTARAYAKAIFDSLNCDAATVNPYLGFDSVAPFIEYQDKGVFILCRTSNPGAEDFQSLRCEEGAGSRRLFQIVAHKAGEWNTYGNIGLVVGATYPEELKLIREAHPAIPLLIPGIGAQGGDLALAVRYGVDAHGRGAIINSSRHVIYASPRQKDFAQEARQVALSLRDQINRHLPKPTP